MKVYLAFQKNRVQKIWGFIVTNTCLWPYNRSMSTPGHEDMRFFHDFSNQKQEDRFVFSSREAEQVKMWLSFAETTRELFKDFPAATQGLPLFLHCFGAIC